MADRYLEDGTQLAAANLATGDYLAVWDADDLDGDTGKRIIKYMEATRLADLVNLAVTDGGFIVGNGSNFVLETGATVRASLGLATVAVSGDYNDLANLPVLGTMAAEAAADYLAVANNLSDLANAGTARTNLGLGELAVENWPTSDGQEYVAKDGAWAVATGGGGGGTPGGSDTQVQFNDGGSFGGDSDLTWDKTTNNLAIGGTNGIDVNPGSDTDADLVTVGVTGAPKISWDQTEGALYLDNIIVPSWIGYSANTNRYLIFNGIGPALYDGDAYFLIRDDIDTFTIGGTGVFPAFVMNENGVNRTALYGVGGELNIAGGYTSVSFQAELQVQVDSSDTNGLVNVGNLSRTTTGTAADGIGATFNLSVATTTQAQALGKINYWRPIAAHATREAQIDFVVLDYNDAAYDVISIATIGTAGGLGFFDTSPVVQQATTGTTTGFTAGSGTAVNDDSTFTGGSGTKAYTIGDIILALKNYGLLAAS